jgi:hypothetical protein
VEHVLKNRKPGEPISLVGHSHGGNVAIEAANILVKKHNIQANEITVVAINTPMQKEITLKNKDVRLIAISAKGDLIQSATSESKWSEPNTVKNTDLSIYYDDVIKSDITNFFIDVNHIGPDDENVPQWLPKLKESIDRQSKDKAIYEKRLEKHNKANSYDSPDDNKESNKS